MARHQVTEKELDDYFCERWVQFAASFGQGTSKRMEVSFDRRYRVTDHGAIVYSGTSKADAIREYNDAP